MKRHLIIELKLKQPISSQMLLIMKMLRVLSKSPLNKRRIVLVEKKSPKIDLRGYIFATGKSFWP